MVFYERITAAEPNTRLHADTPYKKITICTANAVRHVYNNDVKH